MSNSTGLLAILSLAVMGTFLTFYMVRIATDMGGQICTGAIAGIPVPIEQRWYMLHNTWLSYQIGGWAMSIFLAFGQLLLANSVGDEHVKMLGYMAAFIVAVASMMWLLQGGFIYFNYRSLLRQAEAD
jgi:hypothetical protein